MRRRPEPPTFVARLGMVLTWIVLLGFGGLAFGLAAMVLGFGDVHEPAAWSTVAPESAIADMGVGGNRQECAAAATLPLLTIAIFLYVFANSERHHGSRCRSELRRAPCHRRHPAAPAACDR